MLKHSNQMFKHISNVLNPGSNMLKHVISVLKYAPHVPYFKHGIHMLHIDIASILKHANNINVLKH